MKLYTKEEERYIADNYGILSARQIGKKLGRDRHAIANKIKRMGLGVFFDCSDEICMKEVSCILNKSQSTIRYWVHHGEIRSRKRGKYTMISEKDLIQFMLTNPDKWKALEVDDSYFFNYSWYHQKLLEERRMRDIEIERTRHEHMNYCGK